MSLIIYIGAALAVGLLMGFTVLSVLWLRKRLRTNIRDHTVGLISVYDDLLEEKSRSLSDLDEAIAERTKSVSSQKEEREEAKTAPKEAEKAFTQGSVLTILEQTATAPYRDAAAGDLYQTIRKNFGFRMEEVLPALAEKRVSESAESRLLAELDYDTVYSLSTLSADDQLTVLRESLPKEGLLFLDAYLKTRKDFDVLAFYDALRFEAEAHSKRPRLYVPAAVSAGSAVWNGVDIVSDDEICDGFRAEMDGKLYDYCMTKREIG